MNLLYARALKVGNPQPDLTLHFNITNPNQHKNFRMVSCISFLGLLLVTVSAITSNVSEVNLGTTLVALKFDDGVVVGADSRTSVSGYVSNKFARKINVIVNDKDISCAVCRSGSAADTQWLCHEASKTI